MAQQKRRKYQTITVPHWENREVPESMWAVAARRIEHLRIFCFHRPLGDLLANAYLQGINDAFDVAEKSGGVDGQARHI